MEQQIQYTKLSYLRFDLITHKLGSFYLNSLSDYNYWCNEDYLYTILDYQLVKDRFYRDILNKGELYEKVNALTNYGILTSKGKQTPQDRLNYCFDGCPNFDDLLNGYSTMVRGGVFQSYETTTYASFYTYSNSYGYSKNYSQ